jgi:hypothetical protein
MSGARETHFVQERPTFYERGSLMQGPNWCKRDPFCTREAHFVQVRLNFRKRDLIGAREAHFIPERPTFSKRDLIGARETHYVQERSTYARTPKWWKRDPLCTREAQFVQSKTHFICTRKAILYKRSTLQERPFSYTREGRFATYFSVHTITLI